MKNILFMGTPEFSVPTLKALIEDESVRVVGVVTQPDRKVGRKQILTPSPIKRLALEHEITIYQPEKLKGSPEADEIKTLPLDLIITAAYGQMVPNDILAHPNLGALNIHASLLPKYRGAAPIHYALMNGDPKTGITLMYMEEKMDAGNMIAKAEIEIESTDDTGSLFEKLSLVGRDLLMETLPDILEGTNDSIPQDESEVTFAPMISKNMERIDWNKSATEIHYLIRALSPTPGAYTFYNGERFKIWESLPLDENSEEAPGTIIHISGQAIHVTAGNYTVLSLTEVQPAGKKRMITEDYLKGNHLKVGDRFESLS